MHKNKSPTARILYIALARAQMTAETLCRLAAIPQSTWTKHLKRGVFTVPELSRIARVLGLTDSEIAQIIRESNYEKS